MKQLKQLNIFLKLAIASMAVTLLASMVNLAFIFQVYDLVGPAFGSAEEKTAALEKLHRIEILTSIAGGVVYLSLILSLVFLVIGITNLYRNPKQ